MGQQYPYSIIWEKNIVEILYFLEIEPFPYYIVFAKTLNMTNVKYIFAYLNEYSPIKKSKNLWKIDIHTLQCGRKKLW